MIMDEINPGMEWQSHLYGLCYECYCEQCKEKNETPLEEKKFNDKCSKLWKGKGKGKGNRKRKKEHEHGTKKENETEK
jgi:hypothetical protein